MAQLSAPTPDATSTSKGKLQLTGFLGGTAASPTIGTWDGWIPSLSGWSFASASTITTATDQTAFIGPGALIKYTQTTVKYAVVVSITSTTITIAVNTDYVVANAAITLPAYSNSITPINFPAFFNFSPTVNGYTASVPTATVYTYTTFGRWVWFFFRENTSGTSNSSNVTYTVLPFTSQTVTNGSWGMTGAGTDNGAAKTTPLYSSTGSNSATITAFFDFGATAAWTTSGTKRVRTLENLYPF